MSTFKGKLNAGLMALALGSAVIVSGVATATPAQAHGWGHGHGHGWGHRHRWGFGYGGFYPAYYGYGGCIVKKKYSPYGVFIKKVCY